MTVRDRATAAAGSITATERRVVEAVLDDPTAVAFGTVAVLAEATATSGPTVMRVARKLGYEGFRELQAAVQAELDVRLAPAASRIRTTTRRRDDPLGRALATELANVESTLKEADPKAFATAVRLLTDRARRVVVVAGDAERGIATTFADQLHQLRDGVETLEGSPPRVGARVALAGKADLVVAVDVRRYDAWLLDAVAGMRAAGATVVAVTDGPLSPLVEGATAWFGVTAEGAGPFDSHTGTLALLHALVAGAAARLRTPATSRLDRIEDAWQQTGALRE